MNRDPVIYDVKACPSCNSYMPVNDAQLKAAITESMGHQVKDIFEFDRWYCPYCNYSFAYSWYYEDISWHDPKVADEFVFESELHLCCNQFTANCSCPHPITFSQAIQRLDNDKKMLDEFYQLSGDVGADCTSCIFHKTEHCDPLADDLYDLLKGKMALPGFITPCAAYSYNEVNEESYDFKALTSTVVATRYSYKLKGNQNVRAY